MMDILQTLSDLGFADAAILDEGKGVVRIRTSKGWTYERFKSEGDIAAWAGTHRSPEEPK
jgi:hypothetical protein